MFMGELCVMMYNFDVSGLLLCSLSIKLLMTIDQVVAFIA